MTEMLLAGSGFVFDYRTRISKFWPHVLVNASAINAGSIFTILYSPSSSAGFIVLHHGIRWFRAGF